MGGPEMARQMKMGGPEGGPPKPPRRSERPGKAGSLL